MNESPIKGGRRAKRKMKQCYHWPVYVDQDHVAFPTRSVFVKAACHLARGGTMDVIGRKVVRLKEQIGFQPAVDPMSIRGKVLYIDSYGNLVTNVRKPIFDEVGKGRTFSIGFGVSDDDITTLHGSYGEVPLGERVAFFNAAGLLEIAINKGVEGAGGGAARLFGVEYEDAVRIDFGDWRAKAAS